MRRYLTLFFLLFVCCSAKATDITDAIYFGFDVVPLSPELRNQYGLNDFEYIETTFPPYRAAPQAIITDVHRGSQAEAAFLQAGDVIVALDIAYGEPFTQPSQPTKPPDTDYQAPTHEEVRDFLDHAAAVGAPWVAFQIFRASRHSKFLISMRLPGYYLNPESPYRTETDAQLAWLSSHTNAPQELPPDFKPTPSPPSTVTAGDYPTPPPPAQTAPTAPTQVPDFNWDFSSLERNLSFTGYARYYAAHHPLRIKGAALAAIAFFLIALEFFWTRARRQPKRRVRTFFKRWFTRSPKPTPVPPDEPTTKTPTPTSSIAVAVVPPQPIVVDTPAALRALKLAAAYYEETADTNFSDPDSTRSARTTLSLASKQLDVAHRADPNAKLEREHDGVTISYSQAQLRGCVLYQEALTWAVENLSRAASVAEHAVKADPDSSDAHRILGMLYYENRDRDPAIAALTRCLALNPDDIDAMKLLDRAQNMGGGEIAMYKASKAGLRVANAGIGVYNAGVVVRNFFVIICNIFATVWNVIWWPLRVMNRIMGFITGRP